MSARGGGAIFLDTVLNGASWAAVLGATGAIAGRRRRTRMDGQRHAFAAVRPPGHHALASRAMGFCLVSTTPSSRRAMPSAPGATRVLIVDWDVHHGNGTQALVEHDATVRYVSMHQ